MGGWSSVAATDKLNVGNGIIRSWIHINVTTSRPISSAMPSGSTSAAIAATAGVPDHSSKVYWLKCIFKQSVMGLQPSDSSGACSSHMAANPERS